MPMKCDGDAYPHTPANWCHGNCGKTRSGYIVSDVNFGIAKVALFLSRRRNQARHALADPVHAVLILVQGMYANATEGPPRHPSGSIDLWNR